tara:strand:+ start:994 stop:1224 length:231 start_codon:yes stop_codon:yes gene_type:complete
MAMEKSGGKIIGLSGLTARKKKKGKKASYHGASHAAKKQILKGHSTKKGYDFKAGTKSTAKPATPPRPRPKPKKKP